MNPTLYILLVEQHSLLAHNQAETLSATSDDWIISRSSDPLRQHLASLHDTHDEALAWQVSIIHDEASRPLLGHLLRHGLGVSIEHATITAWNDFWQRRRVSFDFSLPPVDSVLRALHDSQDTASEAHPAAQTPASAAPQPAPILIEAVDDDDLLTYLPALYQQPFQHISPTDLALLNLKIKPYDIPSPYPEPSEATLMLLQQRFRLLPRERQQRLAHFVAQLPVPLTPRPAMRPLVLQLLQSV